MNTICWQSRTGFYCLLSFLYILSAYFLMHFTINITKYKKINSHQCFLFHFKNFLSLSSDHNIFFFSKETICIHFYQRYLKSCKSQCFHNCHHVHFSLYIPRVKIKPQLSIKQFLNDYHNISTRFSAFKEFYFTPHYLISIFVLTCLI